LKNTLLSASEARKLALYEQGLLQTGLPVLYNDRFVGRFDPKADRKTKTFYVKSLHYEEGFQPDETFNVLFREKLEEFAAFNGCQKIIMSA